MSTEDEKLLKEAKKLSWDERLQHKKWKVRNDANIDLAALCDSITDPKDARPREFGPLFKKKVADSKALVQEKALDALLTFQRAADADAASYAKEVCDAIVTKCLTGRPKAVEKAQAAFLLWVELEGVEVFLVIAKACVPIVKFLERNSRIAFNISFDIDGGPQAVDFIQVVWGIWHFSSEEFFLCLIHILKLE